MTQEGRGRVPCALLAMKWNEMKIVFEGFFFSRTEAYGRGILSPRGCFTLHAISPKQICRKVMPKENSKLWTVYQ